MSCDAPQLQVAPVGYKTTGSGSTLVKELTNMGSLRVAGFEPRGFELARSGRSFCGGHQVIAAAISPVADIPTTTAPMVLYNASATGDSPPRVLVVKRLSFAYATSGTLSAFGSNLFAGVTPTVLATALTANGSNINIQSKKGTGSSKAFIDAAKTIVATTHINLGGIAHGAETTMSIGYTIKLPFPFLVQPGCALSFGVLSAIDSAGATTPLYMLSVGWDEIEATLP